MRKHFFSFLLITGMLCSTGESFAQTVIINGEKNNRPLRWADFTGNPDNNTEHGEEGPEFVSHQCVHCNLEQVDIIHCCNILKFMRFNRK